MGSVRTWHWGSDRHTVAMDRAEGVPDSRSRLVDLYLACCLVRTESAAWDEEYWKEKDLRVSKHWDENQT